MQKFIYDNFTDLTKDLPQHFTGPNIGLSGGSTFLEIFKSWSSIPESKKFFQQNHLNFFPVDERLVPLEHPDSNWGIAIKEFFAPLGKSSQASHWASSMQGFSDLFVRHLGNPPLLDTVLLGMGEDGHTASLFPSDSSALNETEAYFLYATDAVHKHPRFTLSPRSIVSASRVILVLKGKKKVEIFSEAWDQQNLQIPVVKVLQQCKDVLVLSDHVF